MSSLNSFATSEKVLIWYAFGTTEINLKLKQTGIQIYMDNSLVLSWVGIVLMYGTDKLNYTSIQVYNCISSIFYIHLILQVYSYTSIITSRYRIRYDLVLLE